MAVATKAYTYAPGKAPAGAKGQEIKLKPGQVLKFTPGVGYTAAAAQPNPYMAPPRPAPFAPTPPAQLDTQAAAQAQASLTPQQEEIRRQQALAATAASADEDKITGLSTASADLMAKLGPQAQDGYERAAATEGSLGQGLATGVADDVASRVAADKSFMESQGQTGGPGPDTDALHDTVYDLNGRIPGDTFAEQGAAAAQWGLAQAPIALNAGREQMSARMAQAKTDNDQYAQQLIALAATYPGLKAQALQQLNQYELDKANYRVTAAHTAASDALAKRSEAAQEKAAGLTATVAKGKLAYQWASLKFQNQKELDKAKAAAAKGKTIDTAASKLLGHIVYKDGTEDKTIKVAQTGAGSAAATKAKAVSKARVGAYNYAVKLLGTPVKAPKGSKGAYVAAPGAKPSALFPPAYPGAPSTTNSAKYAAHAGAAAGYADAVTKVWAEIDGDGLIQTYGYTKEQVMSIIKTALARAGWKRK